MLHTFSSEIETIDSFTGVASIDQIANEVGMFSASPAFVLEHGGPLTRNIVSRIPSDWLQECSDLGFYPNIDVRVHRLYPGDFPAVPGWHCDGEFRADYHAQPDLTKLSQHSHLIASVSTHPQGVSLTELVSEDLSIDVTDSNDAGVWQQVHETVESLKPQTVSVKDGNLSKIGAMTLHRATATQHRGWRLFVRASMWHKPYVSGEGSLARQEFVYRLSESKGW